MRDHFKDILADVYNRGDEVSPRGLLIKESQNHNYILNPYERFMNFPSRKLSIPYIKKEFLWYLKGDRFDTSIADYAKIWKSCIDEDGSINSNYGQYIFGEGMQFENVLLTLINDKDSRRASMVILSRDHLLSGTNDYPCTYAINFRIRKNALNMTVHMRSQDAVFGMGNDAPAFSFIHEMMYNSLLKQYPDLEYGIYHHFVDSLHIYERHFEMVKKIIENDEENVAIDCPKISGPEESKFLREFILDDVSITNIPAEYKFTQWLKS